MEYVNDINVNEAVIHILDSNGGDPILNEYSLDLTDDIYKFIFKHIDKCLKDEELKYAIFNPERSIVKEVCQDYLNGIDNNLVELSKELARQMFAIMNGNTNIPSCDLIVASIVTDKGPMIAILKMDYVKNFTHHIDFIDEKIGIEIVPQSAGLPGSGQKIQKAAFIKPIREGEHFNLMVLDKQRKSKKDEEYGANYFINNFLGCTVISNERDMTKSFVNAAEAWTRENFSEEPAKAMKVRDAVKQKLRDEESINIDEFSQEVFGEDKENVKNFSSYIKDQGVEEVEIDKTWAEKKLKKIRLKIDNSIDLYIDEQDYLDSSKFEVTRNGDGTVNMTIKFVTNYIEK